MQTEQSTLRFGEPLASARGALIFIHGRGSSPEDIAGLAESLDVEGLALLAPAAEGNVWYPQRFFAPVAQNEPWLSRSLATVEGLVGEIISSGIPADKIGLIGFSQGACLAVEHAARAGRRYGFVGALSGALIGPQSTPRGKTDLQRTPILLGCAEGDAHIPLAFVDQSAITLADLNANVTKQIYRGSAHTVFPQEITWLKEQLGKLRG